MLEQAGRLFPGLLVAGSHDGYYQAGQEGEIAEDIRRCQTDILFVGMSSPRKELFLDEWGTATKAHVVHGVGGSFDILAGLTRRAPTWYQEHGLEWLYRAYQEPVRLGRRYLTTNLSFMALVGREKLRRDKAGRRRPGQARDQRARTRTRQGSAREHRRRRWTGIRGAAAGHAGLRGRAPRRRLRRGRGPGEAAGGRGVLHRGRARRGAEAGPGERPVPGCRPTTPRCAGFDVAVVAAPTPLRDGLPDLTYLEDCLPHPGQAPARRGRPSSSSPPRTRAPRRRRCCRCWKRGRA